MGVREVGNRLRSLVNLYAACIIYLLLEPELLRTLRYFLLT